MSIKIMLDAGHYGKYNSGAIEGYYESEAMWTLHLLLKEELEKYGFVVHTTRGTQAKDLGVYERGQKAKGYDLFLSLHSNAIANEPTKRVVIIPSLNGKGDALAEKLGKAVVNTMDLSADKYWYYQIYKREYPEKPGVDYYGVIRGAVAAGAVGIIIEHSFHTNKEACAWLMKEDNLKKLAVAEAKTIAEYYGVNKKAQNTDVKYRVQTGIFNNKSYADDMVKRLKAAGFDAFITTEGSDPVSEQPEKKSVTEIAKEVIAGKWYTGAARKSALTKAGYDYNEVQAEVNRLMK